MLAVLLPASVSSAVVFVKMSEKLNDPCEVVMSSCTLLIATPCDVLDSLPEAFSLTSTPSSSRPLAPRYWANAVLVVSFSRSMTPVPW